MNKSTVTVTANPETGKVAIESKNGSEFSAIRVVENQVRFKNGFEQPANSALIKTKTPGKYSAGQILDGKIIVVESTVKAYEGQEPKRAGKPAADGTPAAIVKHNGMTVYRTTEFTTDENAQDVLLTSDAVVAVNSAASKMGA